VIGNIDTAVNNRVQKASHIYYQTNQTAVGKKESNDNIKMGIYKIVNSAHYLVAQKAG